MGSTFREAILQTLYLSLSDVTAGEPLDDPYPLSFGEVFRGPLPQSTSKRLSVGIVPTKETKTAKIDLTTCFLDVAIDFRYRAQTGEVPAIIAETIGGMILRRVLKDHTLNGLAIDVQDGGNVVDLDHPDTLTAEGSVFLTIHYRHDPHDPRTRFGEFAPDPVAT